MLASVTVFIFNDALIRLSFDYMSPMQAIGLRGIFATLWCGLALWASGDWRHAHRVLHPAVLARGVLEAAAAILYLVALAYIPFAIATSINLSTPLFLALLAVVLLKEQVGWRRWSAIAVGFVGVLMVIQPRPDDVNVWAIMVLAASLAGALRDVLARSVPANVPTLVVSLSSAVMVAISGCVWILVDGFEPTDVRGVGFVVGSSLLLACGYQFLMMALRSGAEYSVLGAFRYSSVLWAIAIGFTVWGDVPNVLAFAGIAVIIGSGLYILHRERVRAAAARR